MTQINVLQDREEVLRHIRKVQESFHIKAPDLPEHYPWLNTKRPLRPSELRGKVVLLDFWTYCCINCMHTMPDLKYLEQKYANRPFMVVGVHSAKFYNERDVENIRQAIIRHQIEHPIIVDQNFALWQAYSVHAWPTFVLIDPDGNIEAVFSGEGNREMIDLYIDVLLEEYERKNQKLNEEPIPIKPEKDNRPETQLSYPGKVLIDTSRQWMLVADTNHNRILIADMQGRIIETIGRSQAGFADGDYQEALFNRPQGLALYKNKLLVADTDNHAIRQIDLNARNVRTIAGTGRQGSYAHAAGYGPEIPLNSPWDLEVVGERCFIAMAGSHQIWVLDLELLNLQAFAGTGQEARIDGHRKKAAFAQPSGLTADPEGKFLYVADSEVSSVRMIELDGNGMVATLVGGDLFDFGDEDGYGDNVRLQHPLGVQYVDGKLFLADTFNHKIKIIDLQSRHCRSYLGTGKPGSKNGLAPEFYEPSGLSFSHEKLYVADTNNHRIRTIDLNTHEVQTLEIQSERGKESIKEKQDETHTLPVSQIVRESVQTVSPKGLILRMTLHLPPGQIFTPAAPFHYLFLGDEDVFKTPILNRIQSPQRASRQMEIPIKLLRDQGQHSFRLQIQYFYCDKTPTGTCKMRIVEHQVPIRIETDGASEIVLEDRPK